ncbi:MAG: tRNA (adenosine(37)-N6)-threonylcarbamoyltransferase complex dimerization subunit type 1 TsaB [Rickettsiales bacterium]|jgi:tRNA threonylcarbamoyladenosine biosynthesis protein TsaB|nr:tRNA (adenosine(37)-N6)-threonylcarbamoyltransferase complex dimerization subunit type 1 TsaB [Rickettsiales bacterium]
MIILAIDTATGPFSAALWKDGAVIALRECQESSRQSALLLPMIEDMLTSTETTYQQLTAIACSTGPGSFTGIRVGLAAARGLTLSLGLTAWGFSTLEIMAFGCLTQTKQRYVTSILSAGKGEVYAQTFNCNDTFSAASEATVSPIEHVLQAMPDDAAIISNIQIDRPFTFASPRADHLVMLAAKRQAGQPLSPCYIRPPDAKPMDSAIRRDMINPA